MEVKEIFAMGNARECLVNDLSKRICKGIFHLQGWIDDHSANLRNFSSSLFMSWRGPWFSVYNWQTASCECKQYCDVLLPNVFTKKNEVGLTKIRRNTIKMTSLLRNVQIKTAFGKTGKLCNEIDVGSIEGKQLDLCKRNIMFCHVDCLCLQKKGRWSQKYFFACDTSWTRKVS